MNRQKALAKREVSLALDMAKISIYLVLALCFLPTGEGLSQDYSFKVKYGMIHAGSAKLSYQSDQGMLTGKLTIKSSPWLSSLWSLADSIESTYNLNSNRLEKHIKAIHEGSYNRNYDVVFSDSNTVSVNGKEKALEIQGLYDLPSLLYKLSDIRFSHGDTLHYALWDGKSYGILRMVVEKVKGPSLFNPFSSVGWKLTPLSSSRKSRENQIRLELLLSQSTPHTPKRIEINTKYGKVIMQLEND